MSEAVTEPQTDLQPDEPQDDAVAFKGALEALSIAVHERYPDSARRAQFDAHMATVTMTIEHMHAEEEQAEESRKNQKRKNTQEE